jgi:phospholipase C
MYRVSVNQNRGVVMLKRYFPLIALLLAGCVTTTQRAHVGTPPPFPAHVNVKHIVIVILENKNADDARSQPFMGWLANDGAYLAQYYAITHPSQPNYIAMVSGSTEGVPGDSNVTLDRPHIGRFVTWKTYAENYPESGCHTEKQIGRYVRKHNPFISFADVADHEPCRNIVPFPHFADDFKSGNLPQLSLIIPNLDDDAHDKPIGFADDWLKATFNPLMADPNLWTDTLLVVTFDEDAKLLKTVGGDGNRVYMAFWGGTVAPHTVIQDVSYDHYDLLRTIEEVFHVTPFAAGDAAAHPIGGIWK